MPVTMLYSDHFDDPEELEQNINLVLARLPADARVSVSIAGVSYGPTNIMFAACIHWSVPAGSDEVGRAIAQVTE